MPLHLSLPISVNANGRLATVVQDSPADVAQSVALLLTTSPGERRSLPDYGVADMLGSGTDPDAVLDAITEWEERADPADIENLSAGVLEALAVFPAEPVTASVDEED